MNKLNIRNLSHRNPWEKLIYLLFNGRRIQNKVEKLATRVSFPLFVWAKAINFGLWSIDGMILNFNILCHDFRTMKAPIQEKLKNYLCQAFGIDSKVITENTNLLNDWITDSIHVLTIVQFLENHFKLEIQPEDLDMNYFKSISRLADFIIMKRNQ